MGADERRDRRSEIVAAAYRLFAAHGYERTSTAQICRSAAVSSGTFFHYFPTKAAVLVAVLEDGLAHTREALDRIRQAAADDAIGALDQWCEHVLAEASDPDLAGFVAVLGGLPEDARVTAVLTAETDLVRETLTELVAAGQRQGTVRGDLPPQRLAVWLAIVADGVLQHAVDQPAVPVEELRPEMADVLARLVRPR
ncbi:TetR/AcrR family transcriptional regulator [Auraticoccus monumenti]|uniref:DNA-binding transcriptional regulator, AcrR family n=1 Tax=Auraticoccus monumenti TaxID=675864 RepID=A0A1G6TP80_9ACTN|nr:TetR/AcrR family transcriptional regulator [Auraticoccus monumenti]SDD30982.1 DNA-binding transcriptional regulator, AcrR family [Auraticoccus monumenti]